MTEAGTRGGGGGGGTSVTRSSPLFGGRNFGAAAVAAATVSVSTMLSDLKLLTAPGFARPSNGSLTSNLLHRRLSGAQSRLTREFTIGANFARSSRSLASFGSSRAPADTNEEAMVSPGLSAREPWPMSCVSRGAPGREHAPEIGLYPAPICRRDPLHVEVSGCFSGRRRHRRGGAADNGLANPPPFIVAGSGVSPSILARSSASSGLGDRLAERHARPLRHRPRPSSQLSTALAQLVPVVPLVRAAEEEAEPGSPRCLSRAIASNAGPFLATNMAVVSINLARSASDGGGTGGGGGGALGGGFARALDASAKGGGSVPGGNT